jgi:lipopolysaccharide transport system ATP-binding protein
METDILIVDEVLAVGDAGFQQKCLGKMGDAAKGGRTVILVSHSMASISGLCTSAIVLDSGMIVHLGSVDGGISRYIGSISSGVHARGLGQDQARREGSGEVRFASIELSGMLSGKTSTFLHGEDIAISLELEGSTTYTKYLVVILISTVTGIMVLHVPTPADLRFPTLCHGKRLRVTCNLPDCRLYPGTYVVSLWLGRNEHSTVDYARDVLAFTIEQGRLADYGFDMSWKHGLYFCDSAWSLVDESREVASSAC